MSVKVTYYHAGCPVCVDAERSIVDALDSTRFEIERVDLGKSRDRVAEAERRGVQSVPAIVIGTVAYHINHGADLAVLKD